MIRKTLIAAVVAVLALIGLAAPAQASTWRPSLVKLSERWQTQAAEQWHRLTFPGGASSMYGGLSREERVFWSAYAHPVNLRHVPARYRLAAAQGNRAGWCTRWAARGRVGSTRVSATCLQTIDEISLDSYLEAIGQTPRQKLAQARRDGDQRAYLAVFGWRYR